jgi:tetratricopeptide (TPR) repeat protein
VLVGLAFANAFPDELTYDARAIVGENPLLDAGTAWWEPFVINYWGEVGYAAEYRPVSLSLLLLEYGPLGFGREPFGYVAINIAFHLLMTLLVWRLARMWLSSPGNALVAGALFAVHPLATAVVPNIVGLVDILAAIATVAVLVTWEKHRATGDWRWAAAAAGLWLVGLLSKENAVVAPGLIILRELADIGAGSDEEDSVPRLSILRSAAPFVLAGTVWFVLRQFVLTGRGERFIVALNNPLVLEPLPHRWFTGLKVLTMYLGQALLPLKLSADYSFDQVPIVTAGMSMLVLGTMATVVGVTVARLFLSLRWRTVAMGLLFFFVAIAPVSNVVFLVGSIRGDRFLYLPLVGLCLVAAELLGRSLGWVEGRLPENGRPRVIFTVAVGLLLILGIAKTRRENEVWRTNLSLWENAVVTTPENLKAHYNLAFFLPKDEPGSSDRILGHLEKAVAIARRLPGDEFNAAHINLGKEYLRLASPYIGDDGRVDEAGHIWLEESLAVLEEAEERESFQGRQRAWWERRRAREAARADGGVGSGGQFGEAELHLTMATVLAQLSRGEEAIQQFEKALAIEPESGDIHYRLAVVCIGEGRLACAEEALSRATRLDPANEDAWFRLAAVRLHRGGYREAIDALSEARSFHRGSEELEQTLRQVYSASVELLRGSGRAQEAEELREQAIVRDGLPPAVFD